MSAGISGSYTVFSALMMSSVRRASSSGGMALLWTALPSPTDSAWFSSGFRFVSSMASPEEFARLVKRLREHIHLGLRIIHGEGRAACGGHAEALQERLSAMGA